MSKQPKWGVFDLGPRVDVAPIGHRHVLDGPCWCGERVEEYARPLVVHSLRTHDWFDCGMLGGSLSCKRCGVVQNMKNADGWCKGPAKVGPKEAKR